MPPDRQDEVLALFQQVARDVLGGTQAPPSRWPPLGHMLLAGLLGLTAVSAAAALIFPAQWDVGAVTGPHPVVLRTLTAVTALAAAGAAWATWTRNARVLLVYGAWAALAIASTIYVAFVAIPGAAHAMGFSGAEQFRLGAAVWVVAEKVLLCGIGFGYLFWSRPRTRPAA